jgi:tripartite ATP-independent transporter DctM subunit
VEWYHALAIIFGLFFGLGLLGLPIGFAFLACVLISYGIFMGPTVGPYMVILSIFDSLALFTLAPIPLFILMGELMFHSGLAVRSLNSLALLFGKIPARLSFIALGAGSIFAALSGSTMANTALLGSMLAPEMRRRGYSKALSYGPILASGGLAMIIPPSNLAVIYGTYARVSIGHLLLAGIVPGLLMALLYGLVILLRVSLKPELAPVYEVSRVSARAKARGVLLDLAPLGFILFLVTGLIALGVATPTESAALGAAGTTLLVGVYRLLTWEAVRKTLSGTVTITCMVFLILAGGVAFTRILAYTGVVAGIVGFIRALQASPVVILVLMILTILVLGMFMESIPIIMITTPIFDPIVSAFGWNPVWFGVLVLIALEIGLTTPPFGMLVFVMKGVAAGDASLMELYRVAVPFVGSDLVALTLVALFPVLALWIPSAL